MLLQHSDQRCCAPRQTEFGGSILGGDAHGQHAGLGLLAALDSRIHPAFPLHRVLGHALDATCEANGVVSGFDGGCHASNSLQS